MILDESYNLPDRGLPDFRPICETLGLTMQELESELAVIRS